MNTTLKGKDGKTVATYTKEQFTKLVKSREAMDRLYEKVSI